MCCFELYHNIKRFLYAITGRELCSLDDFYIHTLRKRRFLEKIKALKPNERLSLILQQDKEIFEAWKAHKNLSIINSVLGVIIITFVMIIMR